jgi:hypothetical protein
VFRQPEDSPSAGDVTRSQVVVAGPGSALTVPGIIVSEIVRALATRVRVTRIEVDVAADAFAGLHRAPSLAAAHDARANDNLLCYRAPDNTRLRTQMFRQLIDRDVAVAVAYAWPGIDNDWIRQFLQTAHAAGAETVVLCASLPTSTTNPTAVGELAEIMSRADHVIVGDAADLVELSSIYGSFDPLVEVHPALSLRGRTERTGNRQITAFLPRDSAEILTTMLSAFDAIPEAWIPDYRLHIVMRYEGEQLPDLVAASYHADYVELTGDDLSGGDLETLASDSSALSVAEPLHDSRAFSTAIDTGIATVVLANSAPLAVGRGYVGGLLADTRRPASVHVALHHALRLEDLHFPSPGAWIQLARRLSTPRDALVEADALEPVVND